MYDHIQPACSAVSCVEIHFNMFSWVYSGRRRLSSGQHCHQPFQACLCRFHSCRKRHCPGGAHKGPGGPTRARLTRAHKGPAHEGPSARAERALSGPSAQLSLVSRYTLMCSLGFVAAVGAFLRVSIAVKYCKLYLLCLPSGAGVAGIRGPGLQIDVKQGASTC